MNRTEFLERLDGTEWVDFEVKSAQGGVPVDAFKTLSAFANSGWSILELDVRIRTLKVWRWRQLFVLKRQDRLDQTCYPSSHVKVPQICFHRSDGAVLAPRRAPREPLC